MCIACYVNALHAMYIAEAGFTAKGPCHGRKEHHRSLRYGRRDHPLGHGRRHPSPLRAWPGGRQRARSRGEACAAPHPRAARHRHLRADRVPYRLVVHRSPAASAGRNAGLAGDRRGRRPPADLRPCPGAGRERHRAAASFRRAGGALLPYAGPARRFLVVPADDGALSRRLRVDRAGGASRRRRALSSVDQARPLARPHGRRRSPAVRSRPSRRLRS